MGVDINGILTISTSKGDFRVLPNEDKECPGIMVYFRGKLISNTELIEEDSCIRTSSYMANEDKPVSITTYNTTEEELYE